MADWELSKENYMPLKRGRDASALAAIESETEEQKREEIMKFEKLIRLDDEDDDPLQTWIGYLQYTEEHFPNGNIVQVRKLVEKCLRKFSDDERYTNDKRFLYIWLKFAHLSSSMGSLSIYERMQSKAICTKLAHFYTQWSYELEQASDFNKAAQKLREGLEIDAEPKEKLDNAYQQFQERMAVRLQEESCAEHEEPEDTRVFMGVLMGVGKNKKTPVMRDPKGVAGPLSSSSTESSSKNRTTRFLAFDESELVSKSVKSHRNKYMAHGNSVLPTDKVENKENFKQPAKWPTQKLGGADGGKRHSTATSTPMSAGTPISGGSSKAFPVFQDDNQSQRRQTIAGGQLPQALKTQKSAMYDPIAKLEERKDKNQQFAFCYDKVYAGECEFSFEELRWMNFKPKHPKPTISRGSLTPLIEKSVEGHAHDFEVHTPLPVERSSACKAANSSSGSSVFMPTPLSFSEGNRFSAFAPVSGGSSGSTLTPRSITNTSCSVITATPSDGDSIHSGLAMTPREKGVFAMPKPGGLSARKAVPQPVSPPINKPVEVVNDFLMPKSNGGPSPNGSMTQACYRQAMAAFSDTINIQNETKEEHEEIDSKSNSCAKFDIYSDDVNEDAPPQTFNVFEDKPVSAPLAPFQVFVEEDPVPKPAPFPVFIDGSTKKRPHDNFQVFSDDDMKAPPQPSGGFHIFEDEEKENAVPEGTQQPVKINRDIEGILSVSRDFETEDLEDIPVAVTKIRAEPEFVAPKPVEPVVNNFVREPAKGAVDDPLNFDDEMTCNFDLNEPTLARFGVIAATNRVMSTPATGFHVPPPSFSTIKPWLEPSFVQSDHQQNKHEPAPALFSNLPIASLTHESTPIAASVSPTPIIRASVTPTPVIEDQPGIPEHMTPYMDHETDRLSVIQESSREFRSGGSSCLSSGGSSVSSESGRRKLVTTTAGSTTLKPIAELSCNNSGIQRTVIDEKYECTFAAERGESVVENDEPDVVPDIESAVRRLSLGGQLLPHNIQEKDLDESVEKTGTGFKMQITSGIDPWDQQLISNILQKQVQYMDCHTNFHMFLDENMPAIKIDKDIELSGEVMKIVRLLGEGAFARAYVVKTDDNKEWVIKAQKPACPWEFYICDQLTARLQNAHKFINYMNNFMTTRDFYLFVDGSLLVNEYHNRGTLLDLVNHAATAGKKGLGERISMFLLVQLMKLVEATHSVEIIHADIKPDNVLLLELPQAEQTVDDLINPTVHSVKLIDWGRAIDMKELPPGTTFRGKAQTSGFMCPQMLTGDEWTYQTDIFGLVATAHVMLFGTYMSIYNVGGIWKANTKLNRRWDTAIWSDFFHDLLNIDHCCPPQNLSTHRTNMEAHIRYEIEDNNENWIEDVNFINDILGNKTR